MLHAQTSLYRVRAVAVAAACTIMVGLGFAQAAGDIGATVVAMPDRSDADKKMDAHRQPAKLLDFAGVKAGMSVMDLMAGGGYTTELLARAVGKDGKVYAQNSPTAPEKALNVMAERMKKPRRKGGAWSASVQWIGENKVSRINWRNCPFE